MTIPFSKDFTLLLFCDNLGPHLSAFSLLFLQNGFGLSFACIAAFYLICPDIV